MLSLPVSLVPFLTYLFFQCPSVSVSYVSVADSIISDINVTVRERPPYYWRSVEGLALKFSTVLDVTAASSQWFQSCTVLTKKEFLNCSVRVLVTMDSLELFLIWFAMTLNRLKLF